MPLVRNQHDQFLVGESPPDDADSRREERPLIPSLSFRSLNRKTCSLR
jgi:hypothetical protein